MIQLSQVSAAVGGVLSGTDAVLQGISINTRDDCEGRLFVALKGDNFDAHDFLDQAVTAGAGGVLVERDRDVTTVMSNITIPKIIVKDTHQALKDLAAWWRSQFVLPVVGVTGSAGKTTVKEMLGAIFAQLGEGVVTAGNLNNEIGVPLTLMRLTESDRYAIVEMGMNHAGEIARMTAMTRPTIALINNAAAAHLESLGTIEAVAQAKGEIFEGLPADGVAIVNLEDRFASEWLELAGAHTVITFGLVKSADVSATFEGNKDSMSIKAKVKNKQLKITLNAAGQHNVRNALAAIAVAYAANIPMEKIKAGLEAYRPIPGRLNVMKMGAVTLIDDTYNANPLSMRAAIQVLTQYENNTLIVGDMAELGENTEKEHKRLGQIAAELGVDNMLACGDFAHLVADGYGNSAYAFTDQAELIEHARHRLHGGTILVKGSRSAKMENVFTALAQQFQDAGAIRSGDH